MKIDLLAQLSDLKEIDYRNTLAIASIIEILIEKKIIAKDDVVKKSQELDSLTIKEVRSKKYAH